MYFLARSSLACAGSATLREAKTAEKTIDFMGFLSV
jgi:hypothetical protein